jgi:hypothetical protein
LKYFCATMASDDNSARMTLFAAMNSGRISTTMSYVMWREKNLWNISVLQRVHLFNLVCYMGGHDTVVVLSCD